MCVHHKQERITDCGQACIKTILSSYGVSVSKTAIGKGAHTDQGLSLFEIEKEFKKVGFQSESYKVDDHSVLSSLNKPYILLVERNGLPHYIVVLSYFDNNFKISDPANDTITELSYQDLLSLSLNIILVPQKISKETTCERVVSEETEDIYKSFVNTLKVNEKLTIISLSVLRILFPIFLALFVQWLLLSAFDLTLGDKILAVSFLLCILFLFWEFSRIDTHLKIRIENQFLKRILFSFFKDTLKAYRPHLDYEYISSYFWNLLLSATGIVQKYYFKIYLYIVTILLFILTIYNPLYFSVTSLITLLLFFYEKTEINKLSKEQEKFIEASSNFSSFTDSTILGLYDIYAFKKEVMFEEEFERRLAGLLKTKGEMSFMSNRVFSSVQLYTGCVVICILVLLQIFSINSDLIYQSTSVISLLILSTILTPLLNSWISYKKSEHSLNFIQSLVPFQTKNLKKQLGIQLVNQIEFKNLTKYWDEELVFKNLSFTFKSGEITGIVGGNGSGKTTLLNIIQGLTLPTSGEIILNESLKCTGLDIYNIRDYISVYSSEFRSFPATVNKNISFELFSKENIEMYDDKLRLGLSPTYQISSNGTNVSKGQALKILLNRCLKVDKNIYIFDEPTGFLDQESVTLFLEEIKELSRRNKMIILVSHDTYLLSQVDKILNLSR